MSALEDNAPPIERRHFVGNDDAVDAELMLSHNRNGFPTFILGI